MVPASNTVLPLGVDNFPSVFCQFWFWACLPLAGFPRCDVSCGRFPPTRPRGFSVTRFCTNQLISIPTWGVDLRFLPLNLDWGKLSFLSSSKGMECLLFFLIMGLVLWRACQRGSFIPTLHLLWAMVYLLSPTLTVIAYPWASGFVSSAFVTISFFLETEAVTQAVLRV